MVIRVKICGVRSIEGAQAIRESGAELAGLNFVPGSRRAISVAAARELIPHLHGVAKVGVFKDQRAEEIIAHARELKLDYVQLHGSESADFCAELATTSPPLIKALAPPFDQRAIDAYAPSVAMFLFDGATAGSGRTFDWSLLEFLAVPRPFLIAGGLSAANVRAAIDAVHPWGVDTASGVERAGAQDAGSIRAFVKEAKRT